MLVPILNHYGSYSSEFWGFLSRGNKIIEQLFTTKPHDLYAILTVDGEWIPLIA